MNIEEFHNQKSKVTITQLQRYLPFSPPLFNFQFPQRIKKFLLSSNYNNYSLKEQNLIKQKYMIIYRNYYNLHQILDHLDLLTKRKYTKQSLQMTLKNIAQKYQLIDWYKFYKKVSQAKFDNNTNNIFKNQSKTFFFEEQKIQSANLIKNHFKIYLKKKKIWKGILQVDQIKKSLQKRLILQFAKQTIKEIKNYYQKNKINYQLSHKIHQFQQNIKDKLKGKINFIELGQLLNVKLQMFIEKKKIIYLYLFYDYENKGSFKFCNLVEQIFDIKKIIVSQKTKDYLNTIDQLLQNIRYHMRQIFYSSADMLNQFNQDYLIRINQNQKIQKDLQVDYQIFYRFINEKIGNKYSKYQIRKLLQKIKFHSNLHYLFNQPKNNFELDQIVGRILQKKIKRKMLHSQNEVFYSFKKILLLIISRCKSIKLTKQGFGEFIRSFDGTLKYNSFFSVFRVYGQIINIKRIKQQCLLNSFACYLKNILTQQQYQQVYHSLYQFYSSDTQLPYNNIIDKLNLQFDFVLDNQNIKPLPSIKMSDVVNYRKTIKEIFQLNQFDIIARKYIHQKVASKFVSCWKKIKINQRNKQNPMQMIEKTLNIQKQQKKLNLTPDIKKQSIQFIQNKNKSSKQNNSSKNNKIKTQKSLQSCKTNKNIEQRKYNSSILQMTKQLFFQIIDLHLQQMLRLKNSHQKNILNKLNLQNNQQYVIKTKINAINNMNFSLRSSITNCHSYHQLIGLILYGNTKKFICYNNKNNICLEQQNKNKKYQQLQIRILYRPNIQILGYQIFQNSLIILTSYMTLQFYSLYQNIKYPYKTIKVGKNKSLNYNYHKDNEINNNQDNISLKQIQNIMRTDHFGTYPKMIKNFNNNTIGINLSYSDQSICLFRSSFSQLNLFINKNQQNQHKKEDNKSIESKQFIQYITLSKRQHYFDESIQSLIKILKSNQIENLQQKNKILNEIIDTLQIIRQQYLQLKKNNYIQLNQLSHKKQLNQLPNNSKQLNYQEKTQQIKQQQNKEQIKKSHSDIYIIKLVGKYYQKFIQILKLQRQQNIFQQYQFMRLVKYYINSINIITNKQLFKCQLKQQLSYKYHIIVLQQIKQIAYLIKQHLRLKNQSLKQLILNLDPIHQGYIKIKRVKDYFLKITQQNYLIHQKKIDSYLKNLSVGKHISYQNFITIFKQANYNNQITKKAHHIYEDNQLKIWQKPKITIRDFIFIQQYNLLIYTIDSDKHIYARDVQKNRLIGIFQGHCYTPTIFLLQQQMILISGDSPQGIEKNIGSHSSALNQNIDIGLYIWRLHEDFLHKLCSNKILYVKPFYIQKDVHKSAITSINYFQESNCLVTCSLDSTVKFYLLNNYNQQIKLTQSNRIYSDGYYYLGLKYYKIKIKSGIFIQRLSTLKIRKHINQKNFYNKYQLTTEVFNIEKINIKTSRSNQYVEIPNKIAKQMQGHALKLIKKKSQLISRKNQYLMQSLINGDILQKNMQDTLYKAIKNLFIFQQQYIINKLLTFIQKKPNFKSIIRNIINKYALNIINLQLFRKQPQILNILHSSCINQINKQSKSKINSQFNIKINKYINHNNNKIPIQNHSNIILQKMKNNCEFIFLIQEDLIKVNRLIEKNKKQSTGLMSKKALKQLISQFIYEDKQLQILQKNLQLQLQQKIRFQSSKQKQLTKMKSYITQTFHKTQSLSKKKNQDLIIQKNIQNSCILDPIQLVNKYVRIYELETKEYKFYLYLRQLNKKLRLNKVPLWRLFSIFQQNINKQSKISQDNFKKQLQKLEISQKNIQYLIFYLSDNGKISFFELQNYLNQSLKQSNLIQQQNNIELTPTNLIKSNIIQDQISVSLTQKQVHIKTKNIQVNKNNNIQVNKIRQNNLINKKLLLNQQVIKKQNVDKINQQKSKSPSLNSSKRHSLKRQANKNGQTINEDYQIKRFTRRSLSRSSSHKLTPSNSMNNLTGTISISNSKYNQNRQIYNIRNKLLTLLDNEKKTIWDLLCSSVPQFMQESIITQNQYFDIFKILKSNLKLKQKIGLLSYLKQLNPQRVIDLNDLFQLINNNYNDIKKTKIQGQKYVITYFINKLLMSQENLTIQQALQIYFFSQNEQQITLQIMMEKCSCYPFKFTHFALRQFQELLISQNKATFIKQDIIDLIDKIALKHDIKIDNQSLTILQQIMFRIDKRKNTFQDIFPQKQSQVNQNYFANYILKLNPKFQIKMIKKNFQILKMNYKKSQRKHISKQQNLNMPSSSKSSSHKITCIPYDKFKIEILNLLQQTRESTDKQRQSARKLIRCLQNKRISLFNFFISLDLQKKYYLNQVQLSTGLNQYSINFSFWKAIHKKNQNRLYYYQLIKYLVQKNVLDIKYVDSQIQIAMEKLIKRVIKNIDIQVFYQYLLDKQLKSNFIQNKSNLNLQIKGVNFNSFNTYFTRNTSIFNQKQIKYLFFTFCNSEQIKNSKFSNDQIIKDQSNLNKTFNFKMFLDVLSIYKKENVSKTPQYKLMDYLKKRNISLINQFYKYLQKNKKIKQIAEGLKKKQTIFSKQIIQNFFNQLKGTLNQKQLKDVLSIFKQNQIDFRIINDKFQNIYKQASNYLQKQQAQTYLSLIYKKSKESNVSLQRLFDDFSSQKKQKDNKHKLQLKDFIQISNFLNTGLNKIQLKKIYNYLLDVQNKGYCVIFDLLQAIQNIEQKTQKDQEDYQFDFIIQNIQNSFSSIQLKQSQIQFPLRKFINVFQKILSQKQIQKLYQKSLQFYGSKLKLAQNKQIRQRDLYQYLIKKISQRRIKNDKKYKQLIINLLKLIKKLNIQIGQVFRYFSMGLKNIQNLPKQRFLLLYQSAAFKSNIVDINNLYNYLDQNKSGYIVLNKWQQKLNMVNFQADNIKSNNSQQSISIEQLKVFYKVKIFFNQLYLLFIQKQFKINQIYHYFDKNSTGLLKYNQFWTLISDLGIQFTQEVQKKVINYLDQTRSYQIDIKYLISQLQRSINKKQKTIMETKTSFIFKKNQRLIKAKYNYFITQIIKKQQLISLQNDQNNSTSQQTYQISCIMQIQLMHILKRFGIYLDQQQLMDLRRNFLVKPDYFTLYPIYFMLKNIFQNNYSFEGQQSSQRLLFQCLLKQMIKNKITVKQISKIKGHDQMKVFLKQLKCFTPIEIDIILQNISFEGTSIIDQNKLKYKIRDSYVSQSIVDSLILDNRSHHNLQQSMKTINNGEQTFNNIILQDEYLNQQLRDHLRSLLKFNQNIPILQLFSNKLYEDDFISLLSKLGCNFKKKDVKKYFKAFSLNKNFVSIQTLLYEKNKNNKNKYFNGDQTNQNQDLNDLQILVEHIQKSLNFKGVTLKKQLSKYFIQNYGYLKVQSFIKFLRSIGYENQKYQNETINKFIKFYIGNYINNLNQSKNNNTLEHIQLQIDKLNEIIGQQKQEQDDQIENNQISIYKLQNVQIRELILAFKQNKLRFIDFLNQKQLKEQFTIMDYYKFLIKQFCLQGQNYLKIQKSIKLLCCLIVSNQSNNILTLNQLQNRINYLYKYYYQNKSNQYQNNKKQKQKKQNIILKLQSQIKQNNQNLLINQNKNNLLINKNSNELSNINKEYQQNYLFRIIVDYNFVKIYQRERKIFIKNVQKTGFGLSFLNRLSLNLLLQDINNSQHQMLIKPKIKKHYQIEQLKKLQYSNTIDEISISLANSGSLIIQKQQFDENTSLTIINQKYQAFPIQRKQQFQIFARIATYLNPSNKFIRTKGYYIWQKNRDIIPKCAIRYRWRYIPYVAKLLLNQFKKIHSLGYCCPHFYFNLINLNYKNIIDKILSPSRINSQGKIVQIYHKQLFKMQDVYTMPQIFKNKQKNANSFKCDTWKFGCILYQFIWGHKPNSYFKQLIQFLKSRQIQQSLQQILMMSQQPCQFQYNFYNKKQILKVYQQQFFFGEQIPHKDLQYEIKKWKGFKGLLYPLQVLFGSQSTFYKQQLDMLSQLHQLIYECLNPDPLKRPTIQQIYNKTIFINIQQINLQPYLQTLKNHLDLTEFNQNFIDKISKISQSLNTNTQNINNQKYSYIEQFSSLIVNLNDFLNNIKMIKKTDNIKINQIYTIPKNYQWPQQNIMNNNKFQKQFQNQQQIDQLNKDRSYSLNILKHKQKIRQDPLYNIFTNIFKRGIVKNIIKTYYQIKQLIKQEQQIDQNQNINQYKKDLKLIQKKICDMLLILVDTMKQYNSPSVGFVKQFIQIFIQFILNVNYDIDQHKNTLSHKSRKRKQSNNNIFKNKNNTNNLSVVQLSQSKHLLLRKMRNIIYETGFGNPEYLPLKQYLLQNQYYIKQIIQIFYSTIDLIDNQNKSELAINYFRDRIYFYQQHKQLMKLLKIDLLVFKCMLKQKHIKLTALMFFVQLLTYSSDNDINQYISNTQINYQNYQFNNNHQNRSQNFDENHYEDIHQTNHQNNAYKNKYINEQTQENIKLLLSQLLYCPLFYIHLGVNLRNSLQSCQIKIATLQIIRLLLLKQDNLILQIMQSSSCCIFPFIIRLIIEPPQNDALHDEYQKLKIKLSQIIDVIQSSIKLTSIFQNIQAGLYAIKRFRSEQYLGQSFKNIY